jgi:hypothetical protein
MEKTNKINDIRKAFKKFDGIYKGAQKEKSPLINWGSGNIKAVLTFLVVDCTETITKACRQ